MTMIRLARMTLPALLLAATGLSATEARAETRKDFKLAWSIYVGWMP